MMYAQLCPVAPGLVAIFKDGKILDVLALAIDDQQLVHGLVCDPTTGVFCGGKDLEGFIRYELEIEEEDSEENQGEEDDAFSE